jgi:hypothetical protein
MWTRRCGEVRSPAVGDAAETIRLAELADAGPLSFLILVFDRHEHIEDVLFY